MAEFLLTWEALYSIIQNDEEMKRPGHKHLSPWKYAALVWGFFWVEDKIKEEKIQKESLSHLSAQKHKVVFFCGDGSFPFSELELPLSP